MKMTAHPLCRQSGALRGDAPNRHHGLDAGAYTYFVNGEFEGALVLESDDVLP